MGIGAESSATEDGNRASVPGKINGDRASRYGDDRSSSTAGFAARDLRAVEQDASDRQRHWRLSRLLRRRFAELLYERRILAARPLNRARFSTGRCLQSAPSAGTWTG